MQATSMFSKASFLRAVKCGLFGKGLNKFNKKHVISNLEIYFSVERP